MGASACVPGSSCDHCCHNLTQAASAGRLDLLGAEFVPYGKGECAQDWIDSPAPPAAVTLSRCGDAGEVYGKDLHHGARHGGPHANDVSGGQADGQVLSRNSGTSVEGVTEGYFTRELAELRTLPEDGPEGARPPHTFSTGAVYHGEWKGNSRHGFGIQTWSDGTHYAGCWASDSAHGPGRFVHADGDVFVGQWRQNSAVGYGTCIQKRGLSTYMGEWAEDLQHGHGVEQWDGGARYAGQFTWGKKEGQGVYEWPDGSVYSGEWQANSISGHGHYMGKDGREFRGKWLQAKIHGCGQYDWPDGRSFKGQYTEDHKQGFGIFAWQDKRRFEGFWDKGHQHGHGVLYLSTGEVYTEGEWNMGKAPE